jgi:hypothetical protein
VSAYRVVCVEWETFSDGHRHIVAIGTGDNPRLADERWTMTEVVFSLKFGQDRFYTKDDDGVVAEIDRVVCECGARTLASRPGSAGTVTLDTMRSCRFS